MSDTSTATRTESPTDTRTAAVDPTPLTVMDRCDRCGSRAYVRATLPDGAALLFCGHHGNAHRPALLVAGAALHDQTDELVQRPDSSAAA